MTNRLGILILLILIALLPGCGGGGGGSITPSSSTLRQMQVGDEMTLSVESNSPYDDYPIVKATVYSDDTPPKWGTRRFKIENISCYDDGTETDSVYNTFLEQGEDGTVYRAAPLEYADQTPVREIGKPIYIPGTLRVGDSYSYEGEYADGSRFKWTSRVISYERTGRYMAYRIYTESASYFGSGDDTYGSFSSANLFVVPEIGYVIKDEYTSVDIWSGLSGTNEMISKNF